jgi:hypothetical protein
MSFEKWKESPEFRIQNSEFQNSFLSFFLSESVNNAMCMYYNDVGMLLVITTRPNVNHNSVIVRVIQEVNGWETINMTITRI